MAVLADVTFQERMALPKGDLRRLVIEPYSPGVKKPGKTSYGQSSYGYDVRLGHRFLVFSNTAGCVIDPLDFEHSALRWAEGSQVIIPPNAYLLAESMEYFEVPEDCLGLIVGKSTLARAGVGLNTTPLEPGWKGTPTLEIANHTPLPVRLHACMGVAQVLFFQGDRPCEVPYGEKPGACYQGQEGLTPPRV